MGTYKPVIHKYEATLGGFFVNAFLVETENGIIAIDSTLALSSVKDMRDIIQNKIKKGLKAVLLTHGHPDHYTGAAELIRGFGDIPVIATQKTVDQCKSRDEEESGFLGSDMAFGPEYPKNRMFANKIVKDGNVLVFDEVEFKLSEMGPCESDDDNFWTIKIDDQEHVFSGDLIYNQMHTFFRDGHTTNWLKQINNCINKYNHKTIFHTGHGEDMGIEAFFWEKGYIEAFVYLLKSMLGDKETLSQDEQSILFSKMRSYLPNDKLLFLTSWQFDDAVKELKKDGIL